MKTTTIIITALLGGLCTESDMRELLEQGFEVAVVSDATAAANVGKLDGYQAALMNFRMIANTVGTIEAAVQRINAAKGTPKVEPLVTITAADPACESNSSPTKR